MASATPSRRVLVLYWCDPYRPLRATIRQHLRLFEASPARHRVLYLNVALGIPPWATRARFDVIVLHTTLLCARWYPDAATIRRGHDWLATHPALKLALPQDEYDHSAVLDEWVTDLGVNLVGTNFGPEHRPTLYPRSAGRARFVHVLTGYLDASVAGAVVPTLKPAAERPLDVVYRATKLPYWFGSHGQLKHRIGTAAREAAAQVGLRVDISVEPQDTIHSDRWYEFLASGRAIVGCESGSSALDPRGDIQAAVKAMLAGRPDLTFEEVSARLPAGWDSYRFFAVGPRHLEAVLTRTCQVLVEGEYDGLLKAGVHYVPVRRDLSNLADALAMVRDYAAVDRMTQRAFEELFLAGKLTYASAAQKLDEAMADTPVARRSWVADAAVGSRLRLTMLGRLAGRTVRGGWRRVMRKLGKANVGTGFLTVPTSPPPGGGRAPGPPPRPPPPPLAILSPTPFPTDTWPATRAPQGCLVFPPCHFKMLSSVTESPRTDAGESAPTDRRSRWNRNVNPDPPPGPR